SSPPPQDVSTSSPAAAAAAILPRIPSVFMMSSSCKCEASREFSEASHNGMRIACDRQWFFELTLVRVFFVLTRRGDLVARSPQQLKSQVFRLGLGLRPGGSLLWPAGFVRRRGGVVH